MNKTVRRVTAGACAVLGSLVVLVLYNLFAPATRGDPSAPWVAYSDILDAVQRGDAREALIQGRELTVGLKPGHHPERVRSYMPEDPTLIPRLVERGVRVIAGPEAEGARLSLYGLLNWTLWVVQFAVWIFFARRTLAALERIRASLDASRARDPARSGSAP